MQRRSFSERFLQLCLRLVFRKSLHARWKRSPQHWLRRAEFTSSALGKTYLASPTS